MKIIADENIPFVREVFGTLGEVRTVQGREVGPQDVADAELLMVRSVTGVDRDLLEGSAVRFVGTATIGTDHVDLDYLESRGIGFTSAAGSNANSVAEYVVSALLALAEKGGFDLAGRSIGVVGVGNVGSRVVRKVRALGMEPVLNDPPLARQTENQAYRPLGEALLCDFVTMHVPLTHEGQDATARMVDRDFIGRMQAGGVFLNTSRGGVVDEVELRAALRTGELSAAVLDVWEGEPQIDPALLDLADIGTPHIAGYSLDGKVAGTRMIYEAACEFLGREPGIDVTSLLPDPAVPELVVRDAGSLEETVRRAVFGVYDVRQDDARLREMIDLGAAERAAHFDGLRRNYPVRREFYNTGLRFEDCPEQARTALLGLGFAEKSG